MVLPMTPTRPIDPDALTVDAIRGGALAGVPATVLGFARSGIALARFLGDAGAVVTVYDNKPAAELAPSIEALGGRDVRLLLGPEHDPAAALEGSAFLAASPAVNADFPTTEPRLRAALAAIATARAAGDTTAPAIVSEADLFLRLCPAPTIGVTGTKGKTTTASLVAAVLAADASDPVVLGGNIGRPLIETVMDLAPAARVVIELSELQLPTLSRGTTVAVYTNVTSDHLDRHGSLAAYRRAKARLAELVDPAGLLVLNDDDPVVRTYTGPPGVRVIRYSADGIPPDGVGVDGSTIVALGTPVMAVGDIGLPGRHNVRNALAAIATASWFGIQPPAIAVAVAAFAGVAHRLETIAIDGGIRYVNDSQGTQPDAVTAALLAFDPPVVLIAGGRDKGVDLEPLADVVAERAAAAILIGESGPDLERLFRAAGLARTEQAGSLELAVARADVVARELAGPTGSATVLLSPAAASFDMFVDYEDRGRAFRVAVEALLERKRAAGEDER
jgi:UDP-N-acetylmuramoylalanine--D-glutamate ligase